jgi:hypothetical protein
MATENTVGREGEGILRLCLAAHKSTPSTSIPPKPGGWGGFVCSQTSPKVGILTVLWFNRGEF